MKKPNIRSLLATTAIAALTLAGCAGAGPEAEVEETGGSPQAAAEGDAQAPAEITYLTFQSPVLSQQFWEDAVATVLEDFPNLKVEILYTPDLDRQGYAKTLLATGDLPDVIHDVPAADFAKVGAILPYDSSAAELFAVPMDLVLGEAYSLPVGVQAFSMVYYNKTVFDELDIEVPVTYEDFEAACAVIKDAGLTPLLIGGGGQDSWTTTMLLGGLIGSDLLSVDPDWAEKRRAGEVQFTDPEFAAPVEKWMALQDSGYFNSDALTVDYGQLVAKFLAGEGVMYPMGTWAAATVSEDFEIGVFALPSESGPPVHGAISAQAYYVSATTEYPAQAQAFALAMATNFSVLESNLRNDALLPSAKGFELPSDISPLITETVGVLNSGGLPNVNPFGRFLAGERALPSGFAVDYEKNAQLLLTGDLTLEQFLTELDRSFDELNQ